MVDHTEVDHSGKYSFYTVVDHTEVDHSGVALFFYSGVDHTEVDHSGVNLFSLLYYS